MIKVMKKGMAKRTPKKVVKKAATRIALMKKVVSKNVVAKQVTKAVAKKGSAFMKPMTISAELAVIVGKGPMPRSEVVKKLWAYIRKEGLQDQTNKRNINANENLKLVFGGKGVVSMFEMTKLVSRHLS